MTYSRISVDPEVVGGAPGLRGLRIPVTTVVTMVADGMTNAEILNDLPDLEPEDVVESLRLLLRRCVSGMCPCNRPYESHVVRFAQAQRRGTEILIAEPATR